MAASIVTSFVAQIAADTIEMIGQELANEASLVVDFREDFEWLKDRLTFTKSYVEDAHQKSTQNNLTIQQWLSKLNDFFFDAEDIVDECAAESLYHRKTNMSHALCLSCQQLKQEIGGRIRDLKVRMSSIVADAALLHLCHDLPRSEQEASTSERWKRSSFLESNARPVAIEAKVDDIIRLLNDVAHPVIGVVGMGGVGKTFLLQNVYNDPKTKGIFEICIWLSISQTYSLRKLQADLASKLNLRDVVDGHLTVQRSAELIHGSLQEKKFLIVLDDVWRASEHDSFIDKLGVPAANTNSKIVVTTRNREVCRVMKAYQYHMEVLKEEDSWNLFSTYAFPDYPENKPPRYLEGLARQVESECGKLPLALKIVGASMADQTLVAQWQSKLQKLNVLRELEDPIQEILQLSYDSLPVYLKPCFSYFAFFGEDEMINVEYVIDLWRAEGFIPEGDDGRDVGLKYFYQLCNMCLIEGGERVDLSIYCKLHDLVLDLAIHICKKNKCAFSLEEGCTKYSESCTQSLSGPDESSGCRRIFLGKQGITNDHISGGMHIFPTGLRTLSLRNNDKLEDIPARSFSKVRALRVLDLSGTSISTLPSNIERLKLLRVLNLKHTKIRELPECIRSLKNLRVLKTRHNLLRIRVPEWVGELECLEHLSIFMAMSMPKTISKLRSLRVLNLYEIDKDLRWEDIRNLTRLQELKISIHCVAEFQRMEEGVLEGLVNMRRLVVVNKHCSADLPLFRHKLTAMTHLESLTISRFVVPSDNLCELVNLRLLEFTPCDFSKYPAGELFPNLIKLILRGDKKCKEVRELFGKCGTFLKLRFLKFVDFLLLEELVVLEEGMMPLLEELQLIGCKRVGRVEGLERLKSLKTFDFSRSGTRECRERLKKGGEEWKRIMANNPRVKIISRKTLALL